MGDVIYQGLQKALVDGDLAGSPDVRLMLVMSNFSGETEEDSINIADITTLDEYDGAGYQEIDCASAAFAYDATDDEYQFTCDADEFNAGGGTVAAGSRQATGIVGKLHVDGTDANDIILFFTDSGGFPFDGVGTAVSYTPHTDGVFYLGAAP